jgi:GDPmannose 4,6-dehydratase
LLRKGYDVHGFIRRSATGNKKNIKHIEEQITLHKGDLADATSLYRVINDVQPEELYNFADQDHVSWSYGSVDYTYDITGAAVGRILEIIKQVNPKIKFLQPISSNMFGNAKELPQNEHTALRPQSPYGCAKAFAFLLCQYYRDVFGLFASTTIFYNHESPRRSPEYVTKKITLAAARIKLGLQNKLLLGNLDTKIDFGWAPEYVEAAWNVLQQEKPDDYIICTQETHSVREFLDEAFRVVELNADDYVEFDQRFMRPSKTSTLTGDTSKAKAAFGFNPQYKFKEIVRELVNFSMKQAEKELNKNERNPPIVENKQAQNPETNQLHQ